MPVIDMHAHGAVQEGDQGTGRMARSRRSGRRLGLGGFDKMLDERLEEMDSIGVDMQLVTPTVGFYQYGNELEVTQADRPGMQRRDRRDGRLTRPGSPGWPRCPCKTRRAPSSRWSER